MCMKKFYLEAEFKGQMKELGFITAHSVEIQPNNYLVVDKSHSVFVHVPVRVSRIV